MEIMKKKINQNLTGLIVVALLWLIVFGDVVVDDDDVGIEVDD